MQYEQSKVDAHDIHVKQDKSGRMFVTKRYESSVLGFSLRDQVLHEATIYQHLGDCKASIRLVGLLEQPTCYPNRGISPTLIFPYLSGDHTPEGPREVCPTTPS